MSTATHSPLDAFEAIIRSELVTPEGATGVEKSVEPTFNPLNEHIIVPPTVEKVAGLPKSGGLDDSPSRAAARRAKRVYYDCY